MTKCCYIILFLVVCSGFKVTLIDNPRIFPLLSDDFQLINTFISSSTSPIDLSITLLSINSTLTPSNIYDLSNGSTSAILIPGLLLTEDSVTLAQRLHISLLLLGYVPSFCYSSSSSLKPSIYSLQGPAKEVLTYTFELLSYHYQSVTFIQSNYQQFPEIFQTITDFLAMKRFGLERYYLIDDIVPKIESSKKSFYLIAGDPNFTVQILKKVKNPKSLILLYPSTVHDFYLDFPQQSIISPSSLFLTTNQSDCFHFPFMNNEEVTSTLIESLDLLCVFLQSKMIDLENSAPNFHGYSGHVVIKNGLNKNFVVDLGSVRFGLPTFSLVCFYLSVLLLLATCGVCAKAHPNMHLRHKSHCLLMTDVMSSSFLWEKLKKTDKGVDIMKIALSMHNDCVKKAADKYKGWEVWSEGDGFLLIFPTVGNAIKFAADVQESLLKLDWPSELLLESICAPITDSANKLIWNGLRVRVGVHVGVVDYPLSSTSFFTAMATKYGIKRRRTSWLGSHVNMCTDVTNAAHGGQILLSRSAYKKLIEERLPLNVAVRDIGIYRINSSKPPQQLFECRPLELTGRAFPPPRVVQAPRPPTRSRSVPSVYSSVTESPSAVPSTLVRRFSIAETRSPLRKSTFD
ncbi:hypothetical protein RCL1_008726 [Eukaryota sp. TZLM3-RCL]